MIASDLGFDGLMASLSAIGADSLLTLPGVDEPTTAAEYMRRVLELMQPRGVSFENAWSSAINRIQAPQGSGGLVENPRTRGQVLEERSRLEEERPLWHAAYEQRPPTTRERAVCVAAAMRRLDAGVPGLGAKRAA